MSILISPTRTWSTNLLSTDHHEWMHLGFPRHALLLIFQASHSFAECCCTCGAPPFEKEEPDRSHCHPPLPSCCHVIEYPHTQREGKRSTHGEIPLWLQPLWRWHLAATWAEKATDVMRETHHGQKSWDARGTDGASLQLMQPTKTKEGIKLGYITCCKMLPQPQCVDTGPIGSRPPALRETGCPIVVIRSCYHSSWESG